MQVSYNVMETNIVTPEVKRVKHVGIYISEVVPVFRDPKTLTQEQLTDPDYRLKSLQGEFAGKFSITCSKCHHCR